MRTGQNYYCVSKEGFGMTKQEFDQVLQNYWCHPDATLTRQQFRRILPKFYDFTFDAYISGIGCRTEAMCKFIDYLCRYYPKAVGNPSDEASRIFYAVDDFAAYT
jgi:hypothetical protein